MYKKINIYAINENKEHFYICSTNISTSCKKAIQGFKYRYPLYYNGIVKKNRFYVKNLPAYFNRVYKITQFYASYK